MNIESVDLFYLSMPEVLDIGDGSQDALVVRVRAGGHEGWGECETSPLTSIASMVAPMSHSACKPIAGSVLGQTLNDIKDISRLGRLMHDNSFDLLQADHTWSGIDMALWDLMGKKLGEPVWRLIGYERAHPKMPYASVLFGDTPQETLEKGRAARVNGFLAAKFGWGAFGKGSVQADVDQVMAAREGIGPDGILLIDAGTNFGDDADAAIQRAQVMKDCNVTWFEEPFNKDAFEQHVALAKACAPVKLAGGEGSHNPYMAMHMIDHCALGFIQIDAGRIGGISGAKEIADYAAARGVTYVNHTFTSHLALSASLQPFAGLQDHRISEYPFEPKALAYELTVNHIERDANGEIIAQDAPGFGMQVNKAALKQYLQDVEIRVNGRVLYRTPAID
jgi:L-alanine-DL-glutamate epimerase-like enolase superfamily enzyme